MIIINEADQGKIREILDKNPGKCWRILVDGDGCAGPYFALSLDERGLDEKTTNIRGIEFLVSEEVKRYAEVTTIKIFLNPKESKPTFPPVQQNRL